MLGAAIAVVIVGFVLKVIAAQAAGWFLMPLAAVACLWHIRVHAIAAGVADPPHRLAATSDILLIGALVLQLDYTPGYNCAWDTLTGVGWRLGWASDMGCVLLAGWPAIAVDVLLYLPVGVTWLWLRSAAGRG